MHRLSALLNQALSGQKMIPEAGEYSTSRSKLSPVVRSRMPRGRIPRPQHAGLADVSARLPHSRSEMRRASPRSARCRKVCCHINGSSLRLPGRSEETFHGLPGTCWIFSLFFLLHWYSKRGGQKHFAACACQGWYWYEPQAVSHVETP